MRLLVSLKDLVALVDLEPVVPGLVGIDELPPQRAEGRIPLIAHVCHNVDPVTRKHSAARPVHTIAKHARDTGCAAIRF